jgi:hypothetical protein
VLAHQRHRANECVHRKLQFQCSLSASVSPSAPHRFAAATLFEEAVEVDGYRQHRRLPLASEPATLADGKRSNAAANWR